MFVDLEFSLADGGGDGEFRGGEGGSCRDEACIFCLIAASGMDVLFGGAMAGVEEVGYAIFNPQILDLDDAVGSFWGDGTGHDLDAMIGVIQTQCWHACGL